MHTWLTGAGAGGGGGGGGGGGAGDGGAAGGGGATVLSHAAVAARHVTTTSSSSRRDVLRRYVMGKRTPRATTRFYLRCGTAYSLRISSDFQMTYALCPVVFPAPAGIAVDESDDLERDLADER